MEVNMWNVKQKSAAKNEQKFRVYYKAYKDNPT